MFQLNQRERSVGWENVVIEINSGMERSNYCSMFLFRRNIVVYNRKTFNVVKKMRELSQKYLKHHFKYSRHFDKV